MRCLHCQQIYSRQSERPSREELKQLIRNNSFVSLGKHFNVSDNAIRKWCKYYNLPHKVSDIKKFTDEEWLKIWVQISYKAPQGREQGSSPCGCTTKNFRWI